MTLQAIVFDFDGVLVDSERLHYEAFVRVARTVGVDFTYADYARHLIGYDDRDAVRAVLSMRDGGPPRPEIDADREDQVAPLVRRKAGVFDELVAEGEGLALPGAVELLDAARAAMPVAIASGASRRDIELMLGLIGRSDAFDAVVSADDVARSKPHPQTYADAVAALAAARDLPGLRPGACLAIEDTAAGLASAKAAGLRTLGVTTTTSADALRDAERVVDSLAPVTLEDLSGWYGGSAI